METLEEIIRRNVVLMRPPVQDTPVHREMFHKVNVVDGVGSLVT